MSEENEKSLVENLNSDFPFEDDIDASVLESQKSEKSADGLFEDLIVDFVKAGGVFVCNFAGHLHIDLCGYTDAGILNVAVPSGTTWDKNSDLKRVRGTKSMDCFNVVGIDVDLGLLKLVRVGANVDHYLRRKTALCYDYINKKVISNI